MRIDQIQIITTREEIQEMIDKAVMVAFEKLNTHASVVAISKNEQPVTAKVLSQFLSISQPTLIRWRKKGKIPYLKIGGRILYRKSEVMTAMEVKK
ncbi:MAG: Helix-turn-helix protein [Mucilaginibacter sp.]|uniref:helix-turn-helix domain-containing protein n=1 Tax=Mucilaginibacter sp. TaxID=1882438 RepID=UPI0026153253|nr:helix-turn-helix domain-containing protein [Mucilaginibacter sp.]MDB5003902.1 Helix-turn-helix protein [Mucilaginibacter sp.]